MVVYDINNTSKRSTRVLRKAFPSIFMYRHLPSSLDMSNKIKVPVCLAVYDPSMGT